MADLRRMHLTISKGMKLYCTVEQALEDVIVVSLKHKSKEFRGILLDASQRHLPPGLTFPKEGDPVPQNAVTAGNSSTDGPEQVLSKDVRGATLACRYSYNNDPAKYNEQPLPTTPSISIRSARGKTVRNIRLRPRQTLCSKCKSMIHDNKQSKSPSKILKPEGEAQGETNYHNTRYRAALSGKTADANAPEPMMTRSGLRNRRLESNPKVLLENIRPKREVKSTAKRKTSPETDTGQKNKLTENSSRRIVSHQEEKSDEIDSGALSVGKTDSSLPKSEEEGSQVMGERSVSQDGNSSALGQYNRQPVVRLEKSIMPSAHLVEDRMGDKIPTLQIIANIPKPSPAIKISYGDGAVLKIPPRLPGAEMKSPEGHSTAEESPVPNSPLADPPPPLKKTKKASRKSRDRQRYRIVDSEVSSEPQLPGIKIAAHHRKHKRKHKHRHANTEDENFNSETGLPPPPKLPAIITKFSVVQPVNDMNGNEQKNDSNIPRENSQPHLDEVYEKGDRSLSASDFTQTDEQTRTEDDQIFEDDPLRIEGLPISENVDSDHTESDVNNSNLRRRDTGQPQVKKFELDDDTKENRIFPGVSHISPAGSDARSVDIWGSPVKIETPAFEIGDSPARIEAPPFQSDDSQEALEIQPFRVKESHTIQEDAGMDNVSTESSPPAWIEEEEKKEEPPDTDEEEERKESVPYGTGMFEDLTPDEDEDNHDDQPVTQPLYQLPLAKKPRMLYSWHQDESTSGPHHVSNLSAYFPKNPARVITDNSSVYQKSSRVYQNGPATYYSSSSTSVYPNSPASAFPNSPAAVFQNSPAPRILNSPTPIIQKSPVPIFQYSGSSRYQGSPGRRYGSSPSRRYHAIGESTGRYSVADGSGSAVQRHSGPSPLSRYPASGETEVPTRYRGAGDGVSASEYRLHKDGEGNQAPPQFQGKFDARPTVGYQPLGENSATARFQPQNDSNATRLKISDDSKSVATSARYQPLSDSSSSGKFPSPADRSSVSVYQGQSMSSASQQKYFQGSGSSSTLSPGFPSSRQIVTDAGLSAHSHTQYKSLGSSNSRFQTQNDSRFPTSGGMVPPLSSQTTRAPASAYLSENQNKNMTPSVSGFSDALSPGASPSVFLTQNAPAAQVHSSDTLPKFHNKQISQRSMSVEAPKTFAVSTSASSRGDTSSSGTYYDHKHDVPQGQGTGGVFRTQGQSSLIVSRGQSVSGLSQSQTHLSSGNLSDSDDESDTAVPGFIPNPNSNNQLPGPVEGDGSRPLMMKIQTQTLNKCYNSRGREIRVGDVVWGKVQGFPWWPGRVMSITVTQRDHHDQDRIVTQICHVSWFGSSTMSHMPSADLHPFLDDFSARYNKKKRGPYRTAIQQALLAAQPPPSQQSNPEPLQTVNLQDLVV